MRLEQECLRFFKGIFIILVSCFMLWSCSGGGGGGTPLSSTSTPTTPTSRAYLTVLVDPDSTTKKVTRNRASNGGAGPQGKATLIVDTNNDGVFDNSDKKYEVIIDSKGKAIFKDITIPKGSTVRAKLSIEKTGRAPYEKIVKLSENAKLVLRVSTVPVARVTVNLPNKRSSGYLIFSLKEDASGTKRIEVRTFDRRSDIPIGNFTESNIAMQAIVPESLFPSNITRVTASMKLFSGSSERAYFPGRFEGDGAPSQYVRRDGSNTFKLKSVAFSLIKLEDENGKPIKFSTNKRAGDDTITVTMKVPKDAYSLIDEDADNTTSSVEVPIYRYRYSTGDWEYIDLGTLSCDGNPVNATDLNGTNLDDLAKKKGYSSCYVEFNVTASQWSEYWNIDYPVWFGGEPKEYKVCIMLKDQNGKPLPWVDVWTEGPTSFYGWTDSQGLVTFEIPVDPNLEEPLKGYHFYYTYWPYGLYRQIIPYEELKNTSSSSECDYFANITVPNPLTAKVIVTIEDGNGNPISDKWVYISSEDYSYWNSGVTDGNGTVIFSVKPDQLYYVYALTFQKFVKVNGKKDLDEKFDTGQVATLKFTKPENTPPEVYVWVYPDPVRQGATATGYVYAWDPDGDEVSLDSATFGGENVNCKLSYEYGYDSKEWRCSLNISQELGNAATFTATVSDGTNSKESTYTVTILSSGNNPPQIYGLMIYDNKTGKSVWDFDALLKGHPYKLVAYGWDPDGDNITYIYNVTGGNCEKDVCTFNAIGAQTINVTARDGKDGSDNYTQEVRVIERKDSYEIQSVWVDPYKETYSPGDNIMLYATIYDKSWQIDNTIKLTPEDVTVLINNNQSFQSYEKNIEGPDNLGYYLYKNNITLPELSNNETFWNITLKVGNDVYTLILQYQKFNTPPVFIKELPESLNLTIGESHTFKVNAFDPDGDQLSYKWYVNNEEISECDNSFTCEYTFSEIGSYEVKCVVSDGNNHYTSTKTLVNVLPSGELGNVEKAFTAFLENPTEENYNNFIDAVDALSGDSSEENFFRGVAAFVKTYQTNREFFENYFGIKTFGDFFTKDEKILFNMFINNYNNDTYLNELRDTLSYLISALDNTYVDFNEAEEGLENENNEMIKVPSKDKNDNIVFVNLDKYDFELLKAIIRSMQIMCYVGKIIDLSKGKVNWNVTVNSTTVDLREFINDGVIEDGKVITVDLWKEFINNNKNLMNLSSDVINDINSFNKTVNDWQELAKKVKEDFKNMDNETLINRKNHLFDINSRDDVAHLERIIDSFDYFIEALKEVVEQYLND